MIAFTSMLNGLASIGKLPKTHRSKAGKVPKMHHSRAGKLPKTHHSRADDGDVRQLHSMTYNYPNYITITTIV